MKSLVASVLVVVAAAHAAQWQPDTLSPLAPESQTVAAVDCVPAGIGIDSPACFSRPEFDVSVRFYVSGGAFGLRSTCCYGVAESPQEALDAAVANGDVDVVGLLLQDPEKRADPSLSRSLVLRFAASHGRAEIVRLLLADGRADPRADNSFALRMARKYNHSVVVQLLLAAMAARQERGSQENALSSHWPRRV